MTLTGDSKVKALVLVYSLIYFLPSFLGLPTLILMFGICDGELGAVAASVAKGDIGDLGDIIMGDMLRLIAWSARRLGVSDPRGLSGA